MSTARPILWAAVVIAATAGGGVAFWYLLRGPVPPMPAAPSWPASAPARLERPPAPSQGYVGSTACADCHADLVELYHTHPMSRSMAHVRDADPLEDYADATEFSAPPSARMDRRLRYKVARSGDVVRHHEIASDASGNPIYDQAVPIHFAVGSGQRGRSYVTNRNGLLFMSPITWYSERACWNLSPGYHWKGNNLRFERPILDGCVACHAGRAASLPGRPHCFASEPFLETSIGCERCHGPGRGHAQYHRDALYDGTPDPIINPAKLEPPLRDSVCFQCHLVGEARFARYGRTDFDFRPGDHIADVWAIFVQGTGVSEDQTTTAVSQAEQMLASTCYKRSGGRMSCTSCHDPHSVPAPEERISFYRRSCLKCHGPAETGCNLPLEQRTAVTAEDSCIVCHMPRINANDVPHTSQTDHRVLRSYGPDENPASQGNQNVLTIFSADAERIPPTEQERARGLYLVMQAERMNNELLALEAIPLLKPWLDAAPNDPPVAEALGVAYWMTDDVDAARRVWESGLAAFPDDHNLLRRLVVLYHDTGKLDDGVRYGRRLAELNPWGHEHFGRLAHMLGQQGKFDEAIEAAEKALAINPSAAGIHAWMAEVYALKGDDERRRHHQQLFEKLSVRP